MTSHMTPTWANVPVSVFADIFMLESISYGVIWAAVIQCLGRGRGEGGEVGERGGRGVRGAGKRGERRGEERGRGA